MLYNKSGLNDKEVIVNRKKYGTNSISNENNETFFKLFLETLSDPIIKILLIALGIKIVFLLKEFDWYETIGIIIAIFIASFISTISEYGSSKAFQRLQEEASKIKCLVRRNNQVKEIPIDEVVYNDVIELKSGDKIPADGVIIKGNISVDESILTGETKENYKKEAAILYRGTIVNDGNATMLVNKVGNDTYIGTIAVSLQEKSSPSILKQRLTNLAKIISRIGYIGAFLVSFSYLFTKIIINNNFEINSIMLTLNNIPLLFSYILHALTLSVTIIVVAVPEGLPMMITLVLSSNMKKMLKDNVLVRKLVGIETSGNINILFTDKTGTLTKGKLEVIGIKSYSNKEYHSLLEMNDNYKNKIIDSLLYNNESYYDMELQEVVGGNVTDKAILNFIKLKQNLNIKIVDKIPFNSKNKYSASIINKNGKKIKIIKGAPEVIIENSNRYYDEYGNVSLLNDKSKLIKEVEVLTKKGIRVLGISYDEERTTILNLRNSIFLGLILIKDEIRQESRESIELVKNANINVVMITGDNKETAVEIAKEINLIDNNKDIVLTSEELNKLSDEKIKEILPNLKVIARALPQDKSRLVTIAQSLNLVVGMTGDGVNDAIALKKADVGFAMGSGTEVAKEASDIVIMDDNFLSITKAILYGRTIFKNIRKFIIFQLTVNLCAVSISIVGPFIGINTPITVIQMLWINMVMDTLAGLAFSYEPPLKEYMEESVKKKEEHIINNYMFNEILVTGIYSTLICILFLKLPVIKNIYRSEEVLMTSFFGLFIFIGIFNSLNARTSRLNILSNIFKNKVFIIIMLLITLIQIYLIYYGGSLFRTVSLNIKEFIIMLLISLSVIPFDFIRKLIYKNKKLEFKT